MKNLSTTEHLLANRELLSLSGARVNLATRVRIRTPFGAAEFVAAMALGQIEHYGRRVKIALDCLEIYREAFPAEYERSGSPYFSTQREHELYRLIHTKLFPLVLDEGRDIFTHIERDSNFFLPFIPMRGIQEHCWAPGLIKWPELETAFKLAHALMGSDFDEGFAWPLVVQQFDLRDCPAPHPSPNVGAVMWSLLEYTCAVDQSPLHFLTIPFKMIGYKTGNPWLDLPQLGYVGFQWSIQEVMRLHISRANAEDIRLAVEQLSRYIEADPQAHIRRAVEIWNDAAIKEEQSGYAGIMINDETREMYRA